ncbi:membrane protein [Nakamurella panacisegetis]|uniref:Membrane protein n=1 Tax=Nakamurella panacisegetis TaxID=1090615 RepID=A0A1H0RHG1_9ACTN|nr:YihY/virulence factor BrkB family protein [Nakamurella panacisegetis]SDP28348.1 membrane protein [Nakamurella panacisegetis]
MNQHSSGSKAQTAPDPDDDRKPDDLGDLTKRSWKFILKKTIRVFSKDQCTDLAAGLTYYAVLAVFPALLAIISLLSLFNQGPSGTDALMGIVKDVAPSAADTLQGTVTQLSSSHAGGIGLIIGLAGALWSASGYIGAFGRAMNRVYEIDEGRPFYKLRPVMLLVTVIAVILAALVAVVLVVSGPIARAVGAAIGLGGTAVTVWNIGKWPIILVVVIAVIAVLYYATPNIKQPKFRWISVGAVIAVLVWIVASVGFGFYVANFSRYNKTYGSLAGVIVFLLWLWITNLALLFGAEIDAEIERGRQLQAGIAAEESLHLPPRDTKASDKLAAKDEKEIAEARAIRDGPANSSRRPATRTLHSPSGQGERDSSLARDGHH